MRVHAYILGVGGVKVSVMAELSVKKKEGDSFDINFIFRVISYKYTRTI